MPDIVLAIGLLVFFAHVGVTLGLHSVLLAHVVFGMAFVAAVVRTRLSHTDTSLEEASPRPRRLTGVAPSSGSRCPTLAPGIVAGALLAFTLSVDEFVIAFFTTGPTEPTLPIVIYSMVRFGVTPEINALATILLLGRASPSMIAAQRITRLTDDHDRDSPRPAVDPAASPSAFGDVVALDDVTPGDPAGRVLRPARPVRLRQDDAAAHHRRASSRPTAGITITARRRTTCCALPPNRRPVNLMFQSYALFPHMTVAKNVAYGLEREGLPQGRGRRSGSQEVLDDRRASTEQAARRPHQLSGGQRQRVALARAIVKRPRLLLLDEPLSALDRKVRAEMQLELKRLQHEVGITFVVVTHDQEEAMSMADRIAVMDDGRVQQVDAPVELYQRPANTVRRRLHRIQQPFAGTRTDDGVDVPALGVLPGRAGDVDRARRGPDRASGGHRPGGRGRRPPGRHRARHPVLRAGDRRSR